MPEEQALLSREETDVLEVIRGEQGLKDLDQAAEWLLKTALRKSAQRASGRGRALYPVNHRNESKL